MKLTQNKGMAIGFMILLMVASTTISGIMKVNSLAKNVNQEFIVGEENDGLSISRDLSTRVTRAKNILSIAKNYISESDSDFSNAQSCISVLAQSESKSELYQANQDLQASIDSIYSRLLEMDITSKNVQSLKEEKSIFDNAMNTISYDPYNTLVSEYEEETNTIPGNFFKLFSSKVEYFK